MTMSPPIVIVALQKIISWLMYSYFKAIHCCLQTLVRVGYFILITSEILDAVNPEITHRVSYVPCVQVHTITKDKAIVRSIVCLIATIWQLTLLLPEFT